MREEMKRAIEQGQNFSAKYTDSVSIGLMVRQAVFFLPDAIKLFSDTHPTVQITPIFRYENGMEAFLKNAPGDPLKKEYVLPTLVDRLMREENLKVQVLSTHAVWFGVTYQEDKANVSRELQKLHEAGVYPERLF